MIRELFTIKHVISVGLIVGGCLLYTLFNLGEFVGYAVLPLVALLVFTLELNGTTFVIPTLNTLIVMLFIAYALPIEPSRKAVILISIVVISVIAAWSHYLRIQHQNISNRILTLKRRNDLRATITKLERWADELKIFSKQLAKTDEKVSEMLDRIATDLIDTVTVGDGLLQLAEEREKLNE
jgi:hypothetical protein